MVLESKIDTQRFADLGRPRRVWAVGSVHADRDRLQALHLLLAERFTPGDRIVYLGNLIGWGVPVLGVIDDLLAFRRAVLAVRGAMAGDVVYLRGAQEEMWTKLLQLQFAPNPREVLDWMLQRGVEPTLAAYGGTPDHARIAARSGSVLLARWTQTLRAAMLARPGHENFFNALRRAAHAAPRPDGGLLLVSAGIDPAKPLAQQADEFWWGLPGFARLDQPYEGFARVVRGYDPQRQGEAAGTHTATLDAGCGFGGPLVCAGLSPQGDILEWLRV
jgi:hypothetical protein